MQRVECNGPLFGIRDDAAYAEKEFKVGGGDRLVLYTDGLIEGENGVGETFGLARAVAAMRDNASLAAAQLTRALLQGAEDWTRRCRLRSVGRTQDRRAATLRRSQYKTGIAE